MHADIKNLISSDIYTYISGGAKKMAQFLAFYNFDLSGQNLMEFMNF